MRVDGDMSLLKEKFDVDNHTVISPFTYVHR